MNCPNCSTPIFPGAAFCLECGAKLPAARARVCTACGMELADGMHFCAGCGAPVAEEAVQAEVAVEEPVVIEPVAEETVEATEEIVAEEPVAEPEIHEQEEEIIAEEIPAEGAVVVEEAAAWQPPAQPPQKGGFGRAFLSVLLCILIFILSVPTMLIGEIRMLTSEDGLKSVVDAISIDKIKIGSAEQDGEMVSATEALLDLVKKYDDDIIITEKEFNTFIEKSTIKSFVAKKIAAVADDIYTGKDSSEITKKEVIQLLKDNEKELRKLDLYLDDEMCEQIAEGL
ncbi:MAG: zinc ribbon domain-containing protein, partial [Clostridia bacterium]|nr:zinc ribbon domain-containing protein [Clostridia bacterium]